MLFAKNPEFLPSKKSKWILAILLGCLFSGLLTGCFSASPVEKGSVLVLSFSNISVDEFGDINSEEPHLEQLLAESIRFTHAYTTSVNDAAALASVMTGLYPSENGVHNNGPSQYVNKVLGIPELVGRAHKSSFLFSGGPPILRKSALSRGFNEFDDLVRSSGGYFINSRDLILKSWPTIEYHLGRERFFGVLYFADLLLQDVSTKEKKLQNLDEAIGLLHQKLARLKQWDGLTIVLVGLHGSGRVNGLYDDQIHVPLVIKPARKSRDLAPSWKVDGFLSLADLGATLAKILDLELNKGSQYGVAEFSQSLSSTSFSLPVDRVLFSESDILKSNGWGPRLFAVRSGEWVYWPVDNRLFNTYTDRLETNDLTHKDRLNYLRMEKIWLNSNLADSTGNLDFDKRIYSKLVLAKTAFSQGISKAEKKAAFEEYFSVNDEDHDVKWWYLSQVDENSKKFKVASSKVVCSDSAKSLLEKNWEALVLNLGRDCRDKETQAWIQAYLSYKLKRIREAPALYDLARALTDRKNDEKEMQRLFWLSSGQLDWPLDLPNGAPPFNSFLNQVKASDFGEFVKKRPAL